MADIKIITWNCGGLNLQHKRSSTLVWLARQKVDVALLSETHLLKADSHRMANKYYHVLAASSAGTKTKGVAVIARRRLNWKLLSTWADTTGRICLAKLEYMNRKIALISAYAPKRFAAEFFSVLTSTVLGLTDFECVVGADFNAVWDPQLDRSGATQTKDQGIATAARRSWARDTGLIDAWRTLNPSIKDFTFLSTRHKSFSRIYISRLSEVAY